MNSEDQKLLDQAKKRRQLQRQNMRTTCLGKAEDRETWELMKVEAARDGCSIGTYLMRQMRMFQTYKEKH